MPKELKSINNYVTVENNVVTKISKKLYSDILDFNNINNVQNIIKRYNFCKLIIDSTFEKDTLISHWKYLEDCAQYQNNENNLRLLILKIQELHNLKINSETINKWSPLNDFWKLINEIKNPLIEWNHYLKFVQIIDIESSNLKFVLSHCDLHKDNILVFDKEIFLIDWDFACINNEYFDFASIIYENDLSEKDIKLICESANLNESILLQWVKYNLIFWTAWANYMYEITNDNWFLDYVNKNKKLLSSDI